MTGLVSIIMPSYNTAQYIGASIESVLNQTYTNWELIIVDDCSQDDTDNVVALYDDPRINYYKNEINSGAAITRNHALRMAKGEWIAFLDSDDLWLPQKLEKQLAFMAENRAYFSYTNYSEIDDNGEPSSFLWTGPKKITKKIMSTFNYMGCLTVVYNRQYVGLIQIPNLKKRNDYALWIKVVKKCPAYLLNETLAVYRVRSKGSIMERSGNPLKRMKYNYELWRVSEELNVIFALLMTVINIVFGIMKKIFFRRKII